MASPKGLNIRPTPDKVREAIFNIMGQDLSGQMVLDLFAGTGSLGMEALSRGAQYVLFIDNSQQSINLIKKNLAFCRYNDSGATLRSDLRNGIPQNQTLLKKPFDLVFLDPPYRKNFIPLILVGLSDLHLLSSGSRVITESWKTESLPVSFRSFEMVDTRTYGDTKISMYIHEARL